MTKGVEKGVSLYSFTERYVREDGYDREEMFRDPVGFGVKKFGIVSAQMFQQYPNPTKEEIDRVRNPAEKYGVEPFSCGGYVDFAKRSDRDFNEAEMASYFGVRVCYEIHAPQKPSDPEVRELLHIFEDLKSDRVGFVPDFGCSIERPNELHIQRFLDLGAKRENLEYIIENRWSGLDEQQMTEKMKEMDGGLAEKMAVSEWYGYLSFGPADIEGFRTVLPYARYFHGKFDHIGEDCVETTIPYEKLFREIVNSVFSGTVMTEYEGHSFYRNDAMEQVARHLKMEQNISDRL